MSVGENIKRRRQRKELSQENLAHMVKVSRSMIAQIERGSKLPTIVLSQEIAAALDCSIEDLVS